MKRNGLLKLLVFVTFAACTPSVKVVEPVEMQNIRQNQLSAIDSMMWQQPDSAFVLLQEFAASPKADSLDVFGGHYFQLLLSELLYKNDYVQTNRTELLQAVAYFDSLTHTINDKHHTLHRHCGLDPQSPHRNDNLVFLDARAHYINGVGYYERDSIVDACGEYLKALEIMESHFEEKELIGYKAKFMALTYGRLGEMFNEQLLADPAIACYKKALFYCKREPTSIYGIPVLLYNLGIQYDIANQKDSAGFYYDEALANMPDYGNIHYRDIMVNKAIFAYYNLGLCPDSIISELKHLVLLSTDENEKTTRLLTLGSILFEDKQYDSARLYLETVFEQQEDIPSKIMAAENLNSIYQIEGDSIKARLYSSYLANFTMAEIERKAVVSSLNVMFQDYLAQKQEKEAEKEQEKAVKKALAIIIPIAVLIAMAVSIAMMLRNRRLLKKQQEEANKMLGEAEQTHRMEKAAIAGRLKRRNQEVRELKDKIRQQDELTKRDETAASFTEEPICRLIMERVNEGQFLSQMDCTIYQDYALDKNQLSALRNAADRHFNQFTVRISNAHPELTRTDLDYCCLYLLGLTDADVAALMQRAYNTVNERNSKLRRVFGSKNSISVTLQSIANESVID